jgi:WD40 repeat protein
MQQCSNWGFRAMSGGSIAHASELKTLGRHSGDVWAVAITPDGLKAISASPDQTLKLWDLTSGTELKTLTGHTDYIKAIAITWEGPAGYGRDVTIALWMLER